MLLDWTKPIEFENGEPCELFETRLDGYKQFSPRPDGTYPTRMVHRLGQNESTLGGSMSAYWFMHEDGKAAGLLKDQGYDVVNKN